jgi:hypothetical protein
MPLESEIKQRLSADNSQFRSVMNQSEAIADKAGKSIFKKLDLRSAMSAVAIALGLNLQNIANQLARFIIGFSEAQEEALEKTVEAGEKAAAAQEANLEKARAAFKKALAEKKDAIADEEKLWLDFYKRESERARRLDAEKATYLKNQKKRQLEDRIIYEAQEKERVAEEVARQKILGGLQTGTLVAVRDQAGVEKIITAELFNQQKAREAQNEAQGKMNLLLNDTIFLMGKAYGTSRDPLALSQASDATLEAIISQAMAEISVIESNKGRGLTAGADVATGFLPQGIVQNRLQTDINRARQELDLRNTVRRDVAEGGVENARRRFSGDALEFDRIMERFVNMQTEQGRIANGIDQLNRHLERGVSTVLMGTET